MKKTGVLGILFMLGLLLSGCGGSRLSGKWINYSSYSEKTNTVWEIEDDQKKIVETDYSDGKKGKVTVINVEIDEEKEIITGSLDGHSETIPFSLKDDHLVIESENFYKEGSKAEKEAKEKAKESRLKSKKEDDEEKAKDAKLAKKEKAYNQTIEALEKRLNEEFKNKYQGNWYYGEGINAESFFPSTNVSKLKFEGDKISVQKSDISAPKDDPRKVSKGDVTNYTFEGIKLPKKSEYTDDDSDSDLEYELPENVKEIDAIKTLDEFASYEKEHNIRKLSFIYQSNGGSMSDSELILNVNDLTNIIPANSYSEDTYKKELPSGVQDSDFDI